MLGEVQVYAFAMIAYELFEGRKPFGLVHPIEAARRACMDNIRPKWGPTNRCTPLLPGAPLLSVYTFIAASC